VHCCALLVELFVWSYCELGARLMHVEHDTSGMSVVDEPVSMATGKETGGVPTASSSQ